MKQLSLLLVLTALLTACTTEIGPVTTNEPKNSLSMQFSALTKWRMPFI